MGADHALAGQIESELCNRKPEHFVDKLSLADFYAALERAADVLGQKSRQPVDNTPAPAVKDSQVRGRETPTQRKFVLTVRDSLARSGQEKVNKLHQDGSPLTRWSSSLQAVGPAHCAVARRR